MLENRELKNLYHSEDIEKIKESNVNWFMVVITGLAVIRAIILVTKGI